MSDRKKTDYSRYEKYRVDDGDSKNKKSNATRIIVAVIVCVLVMAIGTQVYKANQLKKERKQLESQLQEAQKENKQLEKEKEEMTTREYIEKIAREKLGLFYPDEYVLEED